VARIVGRRLRERREAMGLSRLAVARAAGITWGKLASYEGGAKLPEIGTLIAISAALRWQVATTLRGVEGEL